MALTEEQKKSLKQQYTNWYNSLLNTKDKKVPEKILNYAINNKIDREYFNKIVRRDDPLYLRSDVAQSRALQVRDFMTQIFGKGVNIRKLKFKGGVTGQQLIRGYARGNPALTNTFYNILVRYLSKHKKFIELHPGFSTFITARGKLLNKANVFRVMQDYYDRKQSYEKVWESIMGDKPVPKAYLMHAMEMNYEPDSVAMRNLIMRDEWVGTNDVELGDPDSGYLAGEYAQQRAKHFDNAWKQMLGDEAVDAALKDSFVRNTNSFEDFFTMTMRDSDTFKSRFPDFEEWAKRTGQEKVDIFDYLRDRNQYISQYRDIFGADATINNEAIGRALMNGWSAKTFKEWLMVNDPAAKDTADYKNRSTEFKMYWADLFGEDSEPPTHLMDKYIASNLDNPQAMWEDIKATDKFAQDFPDWQKFSSAQAQQGVNVIRNPELYKEYQSEFQNAFASLGVEVPEGYTTQFFSSGAKPQEVRRNLESYEEGKLSYKFAKGETPDVATAAGIGDKVEGGRIQNRLKKALDQYRAFSQSEAGKYDTDLGKLVTKRI